MPHARLICLILGSLLIVACSSTGGGDGPGKRLDAEDIYVPPPRSEPLSRGGNPDKYTVLGETYYPMRSAAGYDEIGRASWYGSKFHGRKTSNGEVFDMYEVSAAHKTLPLPTWVKVTNLDNNRSINLRVNDRGPFVHGRIIDLSYAAAVKLGMMATGTARVRVQALTETLPPSAPARMPTEVRPTTSPIYETSYPAETVLQRWYVQIGSFTDQASANALADRNRHFGTDVQVQIGYAGNRNVYRVRLGPADGADEARRLLDSAQRGGHPDAFLVRVQ